MWITPIFNRTMFDIHTKSAKAFINTSDLNRIENNMKVLSQILDCNIAVKEWKDGEFIFISDLERIKNNLHILTEKYPLSRKSPQIPSLPYTLYTQWNDIEKILYDIHRLFYANKESAYFCGDVYTGEI